MFSTVSTGLSTAPALADASANDLSSRERWIELLVVLFVGFAQPIFLSSYVAVFSLPTSTSSGNFRYLYVCAQEAGALLLLWYVLRRRGRTFASIGLSVKLRGVGSGIGLGAAGWGVYAASLVLVEVLHKQLLGTYVPRTNPSLLFPEASWAVLIPFVFLNCFVEEAIVRAYLMTELSELTGSIAWAGVVSVLIQVSYHTYQGWLPVTGHVATFAVFSFYYARKRKLFPLYVGHLLIDLFGLGYLLLRWRVH